MYLPYHIISYDTISYDDMYLPYFIIMSILFYLLGKFGREFCIHTERRLNMFYNFDSNMHDLIEFTATKFCQGRNKAIYGPPYHITIGVPLQKTPSTTTTEVELQNAFLKLVATERIVASDMFGSSTHLATMLNGGARVENLAWNEAHFKLILSFNKKSKVIVFFHKHHFKTLLILQLILLIFKAMITDDSTYALTAKQSAGRSQNDRNEIINSIGANTAAKIIQQKKNLSAAILALVVSNDYKMNFR